MEHRQRAVWKQTLLYSANVVITHKASLPGGRKTSCRPRKASTGAEMSIAETTSEAANFSRRNFLIAVAANLTLGSSAARASTTTNTKDKTSNAIKEFRKVTALQDLAFEYTNQMRFSDAEVLWSKIISLNENNAAAYSNRGNCRTSQAKFDEAIQDFTRAIELAPDEPDCYLGLGVALEGLHKYENALDAYEKSNELSVKRSGKKDAVALNNIGNAYGGLGDWQKAYEYYKEAAVTETKFVFALANQALAEFELGNDQGALQTMKFLTLKYPGFGDMHAAIAMVLWERGDRAQAEDEWFKAVQADGRYQDKTWVREVRRWPPRLVNIMMQFSGLSTRTTLT